MNDQIFGKAPRTPDDGFPDRFRLVLGRLGSLLRAAELSGYSPEQIAKWRDGKARPAFWPLAILAREAGVSLDWLAFEVAPRAPAQNTDAARGGDVEEDASATAEVALIPMLDVVASAGPGFENHHPYEIERLPFPRAWLRRLGVPEKHARFLAARGDSMEPTILDGAIVLADTRHTTATRDGIYVVVDGANVRIKRIAVGWAGALELISDNERYPTEKLAAPDSEALRVAGKVVWAGGEI